MLRKWARCICVEIFGQIMHTVPGLVSQKIFFKPKIPISFYLRRVDTRPTNTPTKRSCGVCFVHCARRYKNRGRITRRCFTMTTHLLAMSRAFDTSWLRGLSSPCLCNLVKILRGSSRGPAVKTRMTSRRPWWRSCERICEQSSHECTKMWQRMLEKGDASWLQRRKLVCRLKNIWNTVYLLWDT